MKNRKRINNLIMNLTSAEVTRRNGFNSAERSYSPTKILWRRGFSFGFSKRPQMQNLTGRHSPPPGTYNISSPFDNSDKGPMLRGLANELPSFRRVSKLPGPGSYDPYLPLGQNAPKYSLKPRIHLEMRSKSPGPSNYYPNFRATQATKFAGVSFGIGEKNRKIKFFRQNSPGPGSYEIPSIFGNTMVNFSPARD
jgi:hypothetical protein